MPVRIRTKFPNGERRLPEIVCPGILWHFPLEDPKPSKNIVLLVWCEPDDSVASFFESEPVEEFPDPEDHGTLVDLCATADFSVKLQPEHELPTREYVDKHLGPFHLLLSHSVAMGLGNS